MIKNEYLINFFEKNKEKSFTSSLTKYNDLNYYGKCKCLSSFLTHLFIEAEIYKDASSDELQLCIELQEELLSLLNKLVLTKEDLFIGWLSDKLNEI